YIRSARRACSHPNRGKVENMKSILSLAAVFLISLPCYSQDKIPPVPVAKHATGLILPSLEARQASHAAETNKHVAVHYKFKHATAPVPVAYDCSPQYCTPIKDQGQCGDCWNFSGVGTIESANIKAGNLTTSTSSQLSEQYILDGCGPRSGGCNGDDATTDFTFVKSGGGVPFASVYGTYTATSGACQLSTTAVGYTISDWGYCDNSTGISQTALIKQAML